MAVRIRGLGKSFRKSSVRHDTSLKSELLQLFSPKRWKSFKKKPEPFIHALKGLDLDIPRGKTVGIVGGNGSGKSTLLKLITGIYGPTAGEISVNGRISALLDLGAGFHPDFTAGRTS